MVRETGRDSHWLKLSLSGLVYFLACLVQPVVVAVVVVAVVNLLQSDNCLHVDPTQGLEAKVSATMQYLLPIT